MDLKEYLKAEFSASGPLIRELMSFFSADKEQARLNSISHQLVCPACGSKVFVQSANQHFSVSCCNTNACNSKNTLYQTPYIAAINWMLQKDYSTQILWGNPWIDPDRWSSRVKLTDFETKEGQIYLFQLIAELKLHSHIWAAHKRSSDFSLLNPDDQQKVESIGLLSKLFKKEVMALLGSSLKGTASSSFEQSIRSLEHDAASARLLSWKKFGPTLSSDFRQGCFRAIQSMTS